MYRESIYVSEESVYNAGDKVSCMYVLLSNSSSGVLFGNKNNAHIKYNNNAISPIIIVDMQFLC